MNEPRCTCGAPLGGMHATKCSQTGVFTYPGGNGHNGSNGQSYTASVQARYKDSKNGNSFAEGLEFQDFVVDAVARECGFVIQLYASKYYQIKRGESVQRCEIKLDNLCTRTNRLSIEVAEKTHAEQREFLPSGIFSPTQPLFYVQGNQECFYLFATKDLIAYAKRPDVTCEDKPRERPTIQAFYLPFSVADDLAIIKIAPTQDES